MNPRHLQAVTEKLNQENHLGPTSRSKTGVRGVRIWQNRYVVEVTHHYKPHYGGRFETLAEAEAAVIALRNRLHTNNLQDRPA